ncbi:MAG TPA: class I SAM-dependent RNA methyltransferase [Terriglobales bacterium]|nr:class I SAM-dependent RNA methyltransferase [Terriglobales bacterium]
MQLQIEKLIYGGDGLARLPADEHGPGKAVFVPFVIPGESVEGEIVETRGGFNRARLELIVAPSAERIEPGCPYFGRCGGCHYQHIDYAAQLRYKAEILRETLRRTAKLDLEQEIAVHAAEPWGYRNRTRMQVRHEPEFALGYFHHGSHSLLPVERCPISSELINRAIRCAWTLGREGAVSKNLHGVQFFADDNDSKLLVEAYVYPGTDAKEIEPFAAALRRYLQEAAGVVVFPASPVEDDSRQRAPLTSIHEKPALAVGEGALTCHAAGLQYRVSGGSFFQVNRHLIGKLVEIVVGKRTGRAALDLYAGAGLFTAQLARNFDQVIAVEASPQAFADLRHNVPANVKCHRMTTEAFLAERAAKLAPDLVVLDPPRAGLGEKATGDLCRMSASRVIYVSCDPATLSRDLRRLLESGYRVEQAHLVDLFPQTYHMETVLHLSR